MSEWIDATIELPPIGEIVEIRCDDLFQQFAYRYGISRKKWKTPTHEYIYFRPTHWRPTQPKESGDE